MALLPPPVKITKEEYYEHIKQVWQTMDFKPSKGKGKKGKGKKKKKWDTCTTRIYTYNYLLMNSLVPIIWYAQN